MRLKDVFVFLREKKEKLAVLATATVDGMPECAVVGYAITDEGQLLINTNKNSRKIHNISRNPRVSLAIGWSFDDNNVQYEGTAEIIPHSHPDYADAESFFFSVNPAAIKFKSPDTIFIRITPTWVRLLELRVSPPKTHEFSVAR